MPFACAWKIVSTDYSELELEAYLDAQKSYLKPTSHHEPCTVCVSRGDSWFESHDMHYAIYACNSATCAEVGVGDPCEWYAMSMMCDNKKRGKLFYHGHHTTRLRSPPKIKLNLSMKRFVREQAKEKLTPSRILNKMIDKFTLDNASAYLPRVQRCASYFRHTEMGDTNDVDDLEKLIASKPYHEGLHDTTTFAFGFPTGPNGDPLLTIGCALAPFVTGFTTKRLIQNLTHAASHVLHVDATFKRNALELVLAQELDSTSESVYLMCFYHVMANVKKYIGGMSKEARAVVFKHVYRIHYSRNEVDLRERIQEAQDIWRARADCVEFERKFTKQWLVGRFTAWQCLVSPSGFAKTNNPVEQFNKQVKRNYTLRSLVTVNTLAHQLVGLAHHRSAREKPFEVSPRPSDDQVTRYKTLTKADRLAVTSSHRSSVAFLLDGVDRRVFCVFQSGQDVPKVKKKAVDILNEEEQASDKDIEVFGQPTSGWIVDVDDAVCHCRNFFKFQYCVHLIAAQVHDGIFVEGVSKKRKFVSKKVVNRGRRSQVGHALAME